MLWFAYAGDMVVLLGVLSAFVSVLFPKRVWLWSCTSACVWMLACAMLAFAHMADMRLFLGVFEHGHTGLAWWYKLAGLWTYFDGSFLLWTAMLASVCLLRFATHTNRSNNEGAGWGIVLLSHGLILLISAHPFAVLTELPPEGLGFLPTLHVAHVVFHPPIMYAGLALLALPAMMCMSQPCNQSNIILCQRYSRWAYVVMTLGLVWGGIWAYTELGWGGMWFWDPVETMALIPWIAHVMVWHQWTRRSRLAWQLSPVPFALVFFQVWGVRSGWLVSIHSFARDDEKGWLLLIAACSFAIATAWHIWRWSSAKNNYSITCVLFSSIILILIAGIVWPLSGQGSPDMNWFHGMLLPFIMVGAWWSTHTQDRVWLAGIALIGLAGYSATPDPTWISCCAWSTGLWMAAGAWRLSQAQRLGHLAFGLLLMSLAWKATWSYEVALTADQPLNGWILTHQNTTQDTTTLSVRQVDHITFNGQPTKVITERYKDGAVMRRMGTIIGWWSHWQIAPVMNPTSPPTYWVGYRHGIHGVWISLVLLIVAMSVPIMCVRDERCYVPGE